MYTSKLTMKQTQKAIKIVKDYFENKLAKTFNLDRVSAPIMVLSDKGINDDLGIKGSALNFMIDSLGYKVEIVQSLAKWKRMALSRYGYNLYEGLYTDMNAIRPLDVTDQTHSLYVDQWDWELIIKKEDRNINFLKEVVLKIVSGLSETKTLINTVYSNLQDEITKEVFFIDSEELYNMYPNKSMREREYEITKIHKTVFITRIGKVFKDGTRHDARAADYDDWQLNGDLLIWSNVIGDAIELSSMGIRVDNKSLLSQMEYLGREDELFNEYYQDVLNGKLPLTIGGGIGQSRMCMILLEKYHIAEVQASIWNDKDEIFFKENKINKL
ncbi:aspartate--ammonia ligase [Haploplasma modicum]|uniref:aspartate--ammonia ligase n=1 Tax=Haploplasma modicum TaxID=2150 RepID=UPI00138AD1D4|nr:aspartate--ammonia ligase [Haploplasma modicum]MCR1808914.1 aspartate--ammonia ligase [Haploplasma modicum]